MFRIQISQNRNNYEILCFQSILHCSCCTSFFYLCVQITKHLQKTIIRFFACVVQHTKTIDIIQYRFVSTFMTVLHTFTQMQYIGNSYYKTLKNQATHEAYRTKSTSLDESLIYVSCVHLCYFTNHIVAFLSPSLNSNDQVQKNQSPPNDEKCKPGHS